MKIGFIGTGTMGMPMAANLVAKGFAVTAYDVVPDALDAAAARGAARAGSPKEAAAARACQNSSQKVGYSAASLPLRRSSVVRSGSSTSGSLLISSRTWSPF